MLDRAAFGFVQGDTVKVPVEALHVRYTGDLENAEDEVPTAAVARRVLRGSAAHLGEPARWSATHRRRSPPFRRRAPTRSPYDIGYHPRHPRQPDRRDSGASTTTFGSGRGRGLAERYPAGPRRRSDHRALANRLDAAPAALAVRVHATENEIIGLHARRTDC